MKKVLTFILLYLLLVSRINALEFDFKDITYNNSSTKIELKNPIIGYTYPASLLYDTEIVRSNDEYILINPDTLKDKDNKIKISFDVIENEYTEENERLIDNEIYELIVTDIDENIYYENTLTGEQIKKLTELTLDFTHFLDKESLKNEESIAQPWIIVKKDGQEVTKSFLSYSNESLSDMTVSYKYKYTRELFANDKIGLSDTYDGTIPLKNFFKYYDNFTYGFTLNESESNLKYDLEYYYCHKNNDCKLEDKVENANLNERYFSKTYDKESTNNIKNGDYILVKILYNNFVITEDSVVFDVVSNEIITRLDIKVIDEANHNAMANGKLYGKPVKVEIKGYGFNDNTKYVTNISGKKVTLTGKDIQNGLTLDATENMVNNNGEYRAYISNKNKNDKNYVYLEMIRIFDKFNLQDFSKEETIQIPKIPQIQETPPLETPKNELNVSIDKKAIISIASIFIIVILIIIIIRKKKANK